MGASRDAGKGLVTLVNPNLVRPGVTPIALDILSSHLDAAGFAVEVVDLTFSDGEWGFEEYFANREPLLIGVTMRNASVTQPQEQRVFLPEHLKVVDAIRSQTSAPIVLGGVGFSSSPYAVLEYFRVPFGVKGPGEVILCQLADALASGRPPEEIESLLLWDGTSVRVGGGGAHPVAGRTLGPKITITYTRRSGDPTRVDNRQYYDRGGLGNILTKTGCPFACNHCIEPDAKGTSVSYRTVESVADELEALVSQGVRDVHTTDSEFNINPSRGKALLREIIARRRDEPLLRDLRLWVYLHPVPFDEEFADLLAEAGCGGAALSAEHMSREHLAVWEPDRGRVGLAYTVEDVARMIGLLHERGIVSAAELLMGLPGENLQTIRQAIDDSLAMPTTVVGYTLGLQIFPHAPLGIRMAADSAGVKAVSGLQSNTARRPIILKRLDQCDSMTEYERQFWFDEDGRSRPVYYFSPDLPEDPETIARPDGRWVKTIRWMHDYVPAHEHYRVALPTIIGNGAEDNNYADNPFLAQAVALGYKGAYYSFWRDRERINAEALCAGLPGQQPGTQPSQLKASASLVVS